MSPRTPDHYATLDVAHDASAAEIKRRYRTLMREVHPDANAHDPEATRKAARLNAAYETLSDSERRRAYDEGLGLHRNGKRRDNRTYAAWAEEPDWEDIVAENVPPARPAHKHTEEPLVEPNEIEIDLAELQAAPRVRRTIMITNRCDCIIGGDVSTSEPWLWGPVGHFKAKPGETIAFDIEVISRKVRFPGLSRVVFVAKDWAGVVPVKITGYQGKPRRVYPTTNAAYVPPRRRRVAKGRLAR